MNRLRIIAIAVAIIGFSYPASVALGQDYAVNAKGDTIHGSIKIFNFGPEKRIQIAVPGQKKVYYPILQVRSFESDNEIYHPVKGPNGYVFMKLVKAGYLSLYNFQLKDQVTYDGFFLTKKDGTSLEVPNLNFKKAMKRFLEDCPETAAKIDEGILDRKDLLAIIDDYNTCLYQKTAATRDNITRTETAVTQAQPWDVLEQKVNEKPDFAGKSDALEMISEIKKKISRGEKVPNFMIEGLKSSLKDADLNAELDAALAAIK